MDEGQARFIEFDDFRVDVVKRRLTRAGETVPLTTKAFDTLLALVESGGEIVEKEELMKRVWPDSFVEDGNLTQNISVLRKALGERPGAHQYILTVPRVGYRFVAEVRPLPDADGGATKARADSSPRRAGQETVPSLAVLPFNLLTPGGEDEYLGLGLADALITRLSNLRRVIVRPTSAVLRYAQPERDPAAAGRELGVELVLEGSVRRAGGRLRATVQLVSAEDGRALWADKFDEEFTDLFEVEDSVAERVATALALRLSGEERAQLSRRYTNNVEAHEFYLRGRYHANKFTLENFYKAIECFDRALEIDPDYALAYAGIAESYWIAADLYLNPREAVKKAQEASIRALKIDDTLAEAHTFLATTRMNYDWDWKEAERHFKRALELNQAYAPARHWYGWFLTIMGRHDEAIAQLQWARQLDPFSLGVNWFLSASLCLAGRYEESAERARELIALEPNFWPGHWALGAARTYQGEFGEAIAAYRRAGALDASPMIRGALAHVHALAGETEEAQAILSELKRAEPDTYVPPYYLALVHLALGERGEAITYLERAYEEHDGSLPLIKVDRRLDALRSEPALQRLMSRVGLAD
ncbi:MAG TPA: winged helix-turn-helix domain-containing protein [Pyrinomonadaceae bacterium]|nr:winged helix-turn-helix domain-containing protein [Pyrinomonadaceae bacterium]